MQGLTYCLLKNTWALNENIDCTKIMSKIARSYSDKHGLKDLIKEFTGNDISKSLQSSDFGGDLM